MHINFLYLRSALIGAESPDFRLGHCTKYRLPMSSMSTPAPLDPAQFSLSRHGHPVQNGEIFFVSKSLGGVTLTSCAAALQHSATASHISAWTTSTRNGCGSDRADGSATLPRSLTDRHYRLPSSSNIIITSIINIVIVIIHHYCLMIIS